MKVATRNEMGRGELLLVVDDEEVIRAVVVETLEKHGYRTAVASNGSEALRIFAASRGEIAAVIIDLEMPVMDGREAIRELRELNPACPVVAVSGDVEACARIGESIGGAWATLRKPFSLSSLLGVVRKVLDVRPSDWAE